MNPAIAGTLAPMDDNSEQRDKAGAGGPDFLDLELSKVLLSEAESITREAFRELLKDAAKARFQARYGQQIEALANLAVDELLADMTTNLAIEQQIAEREATRKDLEQKLRDCLNPGGQADSDD